MVDLNSFSDWPSSQSKALSLIFNSHSFVFQVRVASTELNILCCEISTLGGLSLDPENAHCSTSKGGEHGSWSSCNSICPTMPLYELY